ncbi:transposase [Hyalangium gracile]|uniref:transposase n=1 Tax=Hyalangium gracile TaxID=394092 RepID=UPI001CCBBD6F|nr:transposase [Hyalangium gracile]
MLYEAVRDHLATLLAEASEMGRGLPRYVERDFAKYLECGVLAHGFARVQCENCKDELLVAFSCKGRGVCPSCNAKRAHVTAVHLVENVLPHVPYRQWTLSFAHRVRWVLLKEVGLLSDVLTVFLRAVFALHRRRARRQSLRGGQTGAVSFIQFFGSALQVTPHFHALVPDGVFVPGEGGVHFEPLSPPTQAEVERLLRWVRHRVLRLLEKRGALPAQGPEDARQAYQAHGLQQRLRWAEVEVRPPPRKQPRCSMQEGFSLHANTHLHANDRQGLERLCRYGARGALALERLSRAEDGRIRYRMKRPQPDGTTHLLFTGLELLRRVASLVPPPRTNLTRFHGIFAPGAKLRPFLVPQAWPRAEEVEEAGPQEVSAPPLAPARQEPRKERAPRVDWAGLLRRTFALEVFCCPRCGGRRRVLAYLTGRQAVRAILEHLALPWQPPRLFPARGPPQSAWWG